ncbi:hypothetical protein [Peptoniphilus ovalis]|nr:hypothetical protein [Peptoniphilus ovalis]
MDYLLFVYVIVSRGLSLVDDKKHYNEKELIKKKEEDKRRGCPRK